MKKSFVPGVAVMTAVVVGIVVIAGLAVGVLLGWWLASRSAGPLRSEREQARAELSTAMEMYRAMAMTFWLPETETALAQVEG